MCVPWREKNIGGKWELLSFLFFFLSRPTKRLLIAKPTDWKERKYLHVQLECACQPKFTRLRVKRITLRIRRI